jgi:hypothetical protein
VSIIVDKHCSIAKAIGIKEILDHKIYILGSTGIPVILKLNSISFSPNIRANNHLYCVSNVNIISCKTCS